MKKFNRIENGNGECDKETTRPKNTKPPKDIFFATKRQQPNQGSSTRQKATKMIQTQGKIPANPEAGFNWPLKKHWC